MSEHPRVVALVERAVAAVKAEGPLLDADAAEIPVAVYTDPARLARERSLFRRLPIPIAHTSEIAAGAVGEARAIVRELDGVSLILARGADGKARAFKNACRHRGVRLLREDRCVKAIVCPYHAWTYGTDGKLLHVPHACAFEASLLADRNLTPVALEERHGLLWATLEPGAGAGEAPGPGTGAGSGVAAGAHAGAACVSAHLGEIDDEVASLGIEGHLVVNRAVREQRGNWKMLVEGFLDGYHIRTLHKSTVYRFFHDAKSAAERVGLHIRSASARKAAPDATALRELATFNFNVFPSTTLIAHPDWTSVVTVQPLATDRFLWSHLQLVPASEPLGEKAKAHFDRSFLLIDGEVFGKEDLEMCAEAQAGLETGANRSLLMGRLESPAVWFHRALATALGE